MRDGTQVQATVAEARVWVRAEMLVSWSPLTREVWGVGPTKRPSLFSPNRSKPKLVPHHKPGASSSCAPHPHSFSHFPETKI